MMWRYQIKGSTIAGIILSYSELLNSVMALNLFQDNPDSAEQAILPERSFVVRSHVGSMLTFEEKNVPDQEAWAMRLSGTAINLYTE